MALLFCDSFDHYTVTTQAARKGWSTNFNALITGRNGTSGVQLNSANNIVNITQGASFVCGAAVYPAGGATSGAIFGFQDSLTNQFELRIDATDLSLDLTRNATVLASSAANAIVESGFQFIEFKVTIANSGGTAEARVNGVVVVTLPSGDTQNTANAFANQFLLRGPGSGFRFDDLYVASGTSYYGDVRVQAIYPDSAGNYTQFTPSAGSNYQCVDEAVANDDTDYVSSATAAQKDSYGFGAVGITGSVKGIQSLILHRKDDAGSRTIRRLVRVSGTDYNGSNISVGDSYQYAREIIETNPNTSADWTIADIDGAEFGVELVS